MTKSKFLQENRAENTKSLSKLVTWYVIALWIPLAISAIGGVIGMIYVVNIDLANSAKVGIIIGICIVFVIELVFILAFQSFIRLHTYHLERIKDPTYGLNKDTITSDDFELLTVYSNKVQDDRFKKLADLMIQKKAERKEHGCWPDGWFSDEEIREFILENYNSAETDEEKMLDAELKSILQEASKSMEYFRMPSDWDKNGLSQLVWDMYGIEKIKGGSSGEEK